MKVKSLINKIYNSPIGDISVISNGSGLIEMQYLSYDNKNENIVGDASFVEVCRQLDEYFSGNREQFNLNLNMQGTKFQQVVWREIAKIPYGKTITYGKLAEKIGNPKASRAVGLACNKNPFLIVVPCHRVVGSSGKLTGYAGGLLKKEWLLRHEGAISS